MSGLFESFGFIDVVDIPSIDGDQVHVAEHRTDKNVYLGITETNQWGSPTQTVAILNPESALKLARDLIRRVDGLTQRSD